jgi:hypothetical protein
VQTAVDYPHVNLDTLERWKRLLGIEAPDSGTFAQLLMQNIRIHPLYIFDTKITFYDSLYIFHARLRIGFIYMRLRYTLIRMLDIVKTLFEPTQ